MGFSARLRIIIILSMRLSMDILQFIRNGNKDTNILCEQLFFLHGTYSFQKKLNQSHSIISLVSKKFNLPFTHIKVTGSAHLGISLHKNTPFQERNSDLDLAIIDANLYSVILEAIIKETKRYNKKEKFRTETIIKNHESVEINHYTMYMKWVSEGVIHPKYFPIGEYKREWDSFFSELSRQNRSFFKNISACVYLSEEAFKRKQLSSINSILKAPTESVNQ